MFAIKKIAYLLFLILIISFKSYALASSYYIATDGRDYINDGSITQPWLTFDYALANSQPGDTIFVRQGIYHSDIWIRGDFGGAVGNLKTVMAYPGEEVILKETVIRIYVDYVRIHGFILDQTNFAITADHIEIENNHIILNSGNAAIQFYSGTCSYNIVENNILENDGKLSSLRYGIYFNGGSHNIIRSNIIKGYNEIGVYIYDEFATTENIIIENNFITNSKFRSGIAAISQPRSRIDNIKIQNNVLIDNAEFGIELGGRICNVEIFNNTMIQASLQSIPYVWGNDRCGIFVPEGVDSVQIKNNIFYNKDTLGTHMNMTGDITPILEISHNLYWPDSSKLFIVGSNWENIIGTFNDARPIIGDPLFIDEANDDYQLQLGSPAINAGVDVGLSYIGPYPDLGAFESNDTVTTSVPLISQRVPSKLYLRQNYPNPFNAITIITYNIPLSTYVNLSIYNVQGQKIITLVDEYQNPGLKNVIWSGRNSNGDELSSGIYIYRLITDKNIMSNRMLLLQ